MCSFCTIITRRSDLYGKVMTTIEQDAEYAYFQLPPPPPPGIQNPPAALLREPRTIRGGGIGNETRRRLTRPAVRCACVCIRQDQAWVKSWLSLWLLRTLGMLVGRGVWCRLDSNDMNAYMSQSTSTRTHRKAFPPFQYDPSSNHVNTRICITYIHICLYSVFAL